MTDSTSPTDRPQMTKLNVASWWGRRSGEIGTAYCSQSGWREAVWKRNRRGRWYEASATLRPVIAIDFQTGQVVLGEPIPQEHKSDG